MCFAFMRELKEPPKWSDYDRIINFNNAAWNIKKYWETKELGGLSLLGLITSNGKPMPSPFLKTWRNVMKNMG